MGLQIGLSPTSSTGVVMASYSSRYSRMWAWDVDTQQILGFQDVKGRAELLDVSEDGRYCGWLIDAKGEYDTHIGVSRPYSFHALLWRRAVSVASYAVQFHGDEIRYHSTPMDFQLGDETERVVPGCPLHLTYVDPLGFLYMNPSPRVTSSWSGLPDRHGRTIKLGRDALLSNDEVLIDVTRPEFTAVPHPEWAKEW